MSTIFARTCIAAAICAAALTSQPSALSAEPSARADMEEHELFPFTFQFKVDELASTDGAKQVYRDLKRKAEHACTTGALAGSRIQRVDRRCAADLMASVARRLGSKALTAQLSDYR